MMKILKYLFGSLIVMLWACQDLDRFPRAEQSTGTFFSTENDALEYLAGMYQNLQEWAPQIARLDAMTNNAWYRNGAPWASVAILEHTPFIGPQSVIWNRAYKGVLDANYLINNVGELPATQEVIDGYVAEGRFLRAYWYHILMSYFGNVPYYTELLTVEEFNSIARTPKATVLQNILSDLDAAIPVLPVVPDLEYRASRGAALGIKMRVQLYEKEWGDVITTYNQFNAIKAEAGYDYATTYRDMFLSSGDNGPETIFTVNFTDLASGEQSRIVTEWQGFVQIQPMWNYMKAHEIINPAAVDPTPDPTVLGTGVPLPDYTLGRDPRLGYNVFSNEIHSFPGFNDSREISLTRYRLLKWCPDPGTDPDDVNNNNIVLVRYSDIQMMFAEAENELNGPSSAVYDIIDAIRTRPTVELPPIDRVAIDTKDEVRDAIFQERRIEFAFEGLWYHDMKRRGDAFIISEMNKVILPDDKRATSFSAQGTDKFMLLSVPQSEIDINENLKPNNPGY